MPNDPAFLKALHDENFRAAREGLKANEGVWSMQLGYIFGHPAAVELDFESLDGDFALIQPFIHQALTGAITSLPSAVLEKRLPRQIAENCSKLMVSAARDGACRASFLEGVLHLWVPLNKAGGPPPMDAIQAAWQRLGDGNASGANASAVNASRGVLPREAREAVVAPAASDAVDAASEAASAAEANAATSATVPSGDPYARAAAFMLSLEAAMREDGLWPGEKPAGEIEVRGAFGSENMAFTQWLTWVLIPRVKAIVAERGSFPGQSQVSTYATREFDGQDEAARTLEVLRGFDAMINNLPPKAT